MIAATNIVLLPVAVATLQVGVGVDEHGLESEMSSTAGAGAEPLEPIATSHRNKDEHHQLLEEDVDLHGVDIRELHSVVNISLRFI
ncbi:hypothetical protein L596_029329 [Steinernema carpocapsae]|uniref:Secreted protein n=1 Tax=Steinernema carpocapsae TaxID=34508 RepID=A0A4U5LUA8_STECR|nr:hypothetical protein L596_029329 [Steinernema carpocapsae]